VSLTAQELAPRNQHGALLEPGTYRNIEISDMYLLEDISEEMLVPADEVPAFQPTAASKRAFKAAYDPDFNSGFSFRSERKSDFEAGTYLPSAKKVRTILVLLKFYITE